MAARKKTPAKKKPTTRKAAPKKKATATAASKAPRKKSPTRKKKAAPSTGKAAPGKAAAEKAAPKEAVPRKAAASPPKPAAQGGFASRDVNMGHVFALRPRPSTSFKQEHFLEARRLLEEERYASSEEAARAVVEKALDLTQGRAEGRRDKRRRGY